MPASLTSPVDRFAPPLRRGLLWLAALTAAGIGVELAVERHWTQPAQLIAWGALALTLASIGLVSRGPTATRVRIARGLDQIRQAVFALGIIAVIDLKSIQRRPKGSDL